MSEKKSNSGCVIGLLIAAGAGVVGIAVIGILAAIAIPAFLRYIETSKAAEVRPQLMGAAMMVEEHYATHCEFPPLPPAPTGRVEICGGEKYTPDLTGWEPFFFGVPDALYFVYSVERTGENEITIFGQAEFRCGGVPHSHHVRIEGDPNTCETVATLNTDSQP